MDDLSRVLDVGRPDLAALWSWQVERHMFRWAVAEWASEALIAELKRYEFARFEPIGIMAVMATPAPEPGSLAALAEERLARHLTREEQNERATVWWQRATGRDRWLN